VGRARRRRARRRQTTEDTEDTEKANHREHGEHGEKQTTEDTEDTEMGREGADTLVHPHKARHWVEQRAVGKGHPGRLESLPHNGRDTEGTEKTNHREHGGHGDGERGGGLGWSAQACGPDGNRTPVPLGIVWLCRRDRRHGKPGGLLHRKCRHGKAGGLLHAGAAACSTGAGGGGLAPGGGGGGGARCRIALDQGARYEADCALCEHTLDG